MSDPNAPPVTLDLARLGAATPPYGSIPDGRPPGRLDNGQGGPALPSSVPDSPGAGLVTPPAHDWKKVATAGTALVATAALVAYLYKDHQTTVLARNGGADDVRASAKRKRNGKRDKRRSRYAGLTGKPARTPKSSARDDDDDDDDEDEDDE
jgi:hypothetical protein